MPDRPLDRRHFLGHATVGLSTGLAVSATGSAESPQRSDHGNTKSEKKVDRRNVWVASICQHKLSARTPEEMSAKVLRRMKEVVPTNPDIICLPECFHVANIHGSGRPPLPDTAEVPIGKISRPFAKFARDHRCYVICPIHTIDSGRYYNSAVVIDRAGQLVGEYRKINPTEDELKNGITPGPVDPPVFDCDFGRIGVQICFDINWQSNWQRLAEKGAEIVFWPSAFAGGQMLNAMAATYKYHVVSATRIQSSKIIGPMGDDIFSTGRFGEVICGPLNLESAVIQGWQEIAKLERAVTKYGRGVKMTVKHDEAWALIESLDDSIDVDSVLEEFSIETSRDMLMRNTRLQNQSRISPDDES
ncbi:carbon-nitrogen hydrolase family protein [Crateriforma conspicua]|uniref:carbon-nitrogen hydrolase family protein n=1 Tax=Crateriforma conspicua TaxID=2527996 RepID=UPI0013FD0D78|nr:carbon-nitrogen hydrolase family protein [Crateriforma conspicua]